MIFMLIDINDNNNDDITFILSFIKGNKKLNKVSFKW